VVSACAGTVAANADTATAHNNFVCRLILGLSLGKQLNGDMLAYAPARDKAADNRCAKNSHGGSPLIHPWFSMTARVSIPFSIHTGAFMMTMSSRAAAVAFASLFLVSSAFAQTTTSPATSTPATTAPAKKAEKPKSPESLECSKQADEKGLHGKERKKFRSDCMKEAKANAATKSK
jgi:hypothetical protein